MGVADLRLGREEEAHKLSKRIDLSGGHYAWAQFGPGLLLCRRGDTPKQWNVIREGLEWMGGQP